MPERKRSVAAFASFVFTLSSLVCFSACTDYVSQIEDRIDDVKAISGPVEESSMTDGRDRQTYKVVKIGSQYWMAENLNYKTDSSYCYGDSAANCSKYGRLYTYESAKNACPAGWHLPTQSEYETLFKTIGGVSSAGTKLKTVSGSANGTDDFGFNALLVGSRDYNGNYSNESFGTGFWTATESEKNTAYYVDLYYNNDFVIFYGTNKRDAYSVRCLADSETSLDKASPKSSSATVPLSSSSNVVLRTMTDARDNQTYKIVEIGERTWMAENLNYKMDGSFCYDDNADNCSKYGRLYTWTAATSACPAGWHLPSQREWSSLISLGDGWGLKSTSGWNNEGYGWDIVSFSALPAGFKDRNGNFSGEGDYAYFWSSTEISISDVFYMCLGGGGDHAVLMQSTCRFEGRSVRCLKD